MKHDGTLARVIAWLQQIDEATITDLVARVAPWLAPLPTANLVFLSLKRHFDWAGWAYWVEAIVVETLGLAAVNTALMFFEHNQGLKEGDKRRAPFGLAAVLVAVYLGVVLGLTILLDTKPELAHVAPVCFPFNSLIGVAILALRSAHKRRVEEMILSRAAPYNKKKHRLIRDRLLAEMSDHRSTTGDKGDHRSVTGNKSDQGSVIERSGSDQETNIDTWRAIASGLDGRRATIRTADVIELLEQSGYRPPAKSTARRWARLTRRGEL